MNISELESELKRDGHVVIRSKTKTGCPFLSAWLGHGSLVHIVPARQRIIKGSGIGAFHVYLKNPPDRVCNDHGKCQSKYIRR